MIFTIFFLLFMLLFTFPSFLFFVLILIFFIPFKRNNVFISLAVVSEWRGGVQVGTGSKKKVATNGFQPRQAEDWHWKFKGKMRNYCIIYSFGFQMIGDAEHLLVLQTVARDQTGKYKCQVTMDAPPFQFIESAAHLTVMVLPERHPVISGLKKTTYLPGDKLSINCTSSPSYPSAKLSWFLNKKKVDRWMVTSFLPLTDQQGLESSTLGLNFLVLPEHFRGPEMELWATCKAAMPSTHGVELPIERTLLLGSLNNKLQYYQGGWATAGLRCDEKMLKLLLIIMTVMLTMIRGTRTLLW